MKAQELKGILLRRSKGTQLAEYLLDGLSIGQGAYILIMNWWIAEGQLNI
jgi:hypothetical protein